MRDLYSAMTTACRDMGIVPPGALPPPGKWHEADIDGDPHGKGDARIKTFPDGEGGIVCNWKSGEKQPFFAGNNESLTPEQRAARHQAAEAARARADADLRREREDAASKAVAIWKAAKPAPEDHPYLRRKGIKASGARLHNDALVIPMRANGETHSLQFIAPDGDKRFLTGGRVTGCYFSIGNPTGAAALCIVEGFATGATIHEATGHPVAVAFNAGNLGAVAKAMRERFADLPLILCADDDAETEGNPGITKATEAARSVGGLVAVPDFGSDRPEKATDFNDMAGLHGLEAVKRAIAGAKAPDKAMPQPVQENATAGDPERRIVVVTLMDFVTRDIPPRERILSPWLLTQSLNMLYAWRGVGKTHVALGIAYATASGGGFLKWEARQPRRVLYLDGEMPAASMQERLKGLVAGSDNDFDPDYFRLVTPDLQTGCMPDLATAEGQEAIDAVMGDTELIVVDNLSSLARAGGRENDAESWLPIQPWALRQRQMGRSVLFVHHSGKGGAQRGTSKKEDILDTVLTLKRPSDYNPAEGAVFEVHFEKTRDMHGEDAEPFEARLQSDEHGSSAWTFSSVEDSTFDRVVTLANEGLSQKDIALELDINKSSVSRHFRKATDAGLIQKGGNHVPF